MIFMRHSSGGINLKYKRIIAGFKSNFKQLLIKSQPAQPRAMNFVIDQLLENQKSIIASIGALHTR